MGVASSLASDVANAVKSDTVSNDASMVCETSVSKLAEEVASSLSRASTKAVISDEEEGISVDASSESCPPIESTLEAGNLLGLTAVVKNTFVHIALPWQTGSKKRRSHSAPACVRTCFVANTHEATVPTSAQELAAGAEVAIQDLTRLPEFNGLAGVVQAWDAEAGRYHVMLSGMAGVCDSRLVKVKRENIRLLIPPPPDFTPCCNDGCDFLSQLPNTPRWDEPQPTWGNLELGDLSSSMLDVPEWPISPLVHSDEWFIRACTSSEFLDLSPHVSVNPTHATMFYQPR